MVQHFHLLNNGLFPLWGNISIKEKAYKQNNIWLSFSVFYSGQGYGTAVTLATERHWKLQKYPHREEDEDGPDEE